MTIGGFDESNPYKNDQNVGLMNQAPTKNQAPIKRSIINVDLMGQIPTEGGSIS
jgi:hypothetical protein